MKITFLGDMMCEPPVLKAARRRKGRYDFSGVFANVKDLLAEADLTVGNLETPLAGKQAKYTQSHVNFNTPDEYVDAMIDAGIDLISTANNHTLDRGFEGMERTIRVLDEKGLAHTGSFLPNEKRHEAFYLERDGVRIAVIAYTYGTNYKGSGKRHLVEGDYADSINLLCAQEAYPYLPGVLRKQTFIDKLFRKLSFIKDPNVAGKVKRFFGMTATYSRHDDYMEKKTDTKYIKQLQQDIRAAKEKADIVIVYPHVGGQFNEKPGAFTEYVFEKAIEAGADAVVATHAHIPQRFVWRGNVPCAFCLGNFNMNPHSYLMMPEILTDYGYALHLYVEDKRIVRAGFSMLKNTVGKDGQITAYPVDRLYATLKRKKDRERLEAEIRHLYGRVTGRVLGGDVVRGEYEL